MSQQLINIGANPNDGSGNPLRTGGQAINANFTELYGGAQTAPLGILYAAAFGAKGDGITDDTAALNTAIAALTAGQTLKGFPGKTYKIAGAGTPATSLVVPTGKTGITLDFTGATIKSAAGFGYDVPGGGGGGAIGLLNVASDDVTFYGTLDGNSEAAFAVALKMWDGTSGTGFRIFGTIKGLNESLSRSWTGISWSMATNITSGVTVTSTYHQATIGVLKRVGCPFYDGTTITGHGDTHCLMVSGPTTDTGSTAMFLVRSSAQWNVVIMKPDPVGVILFVPKQSGNTACGDLVCSDMGSNLIEGYGTSIANSATYNMVNNDTLGFAAKFASAHAYAHANLGSDNTFPSMVIAARAAGQCEIDFDYNPAQGSAGGRTIFKQTSPTTLATGLDARNQDQVFVTLTGALLIAAPTNVRKGQRIIFIFVQDGAGGHTVSWNAVFKTAWSDTGNTANKRSSIEFTYDGTNWTQVNAQSPYV